jgi:hypothetical protein
VTKVAEKKKISPKAASSKSSKSKPKAAATRVTKKRQMKVLKKVT